MKTSKTQKNIPNGWPEVRLVNIGSFSKGAGILKEQLTKSGNNAVRYGELYTRFNFQIKKIYSHIPDSILLETKKIKYGDILFAGSGETIDEIGKSAAYLLKEDCYAGGDLIIFSPKNANSLFLSYFLNVGEARKKLRELGQGQSVVHIYKSDIENLKLHLPSLPEQIRIVIVLETWDKAIERLAKKIEFKKNIKKGLMQKLLTGKLRLSGFSEAWQVVKLGDVCDYKNGKSFEDKVVKNGKYQLITLNSLDINGDLKNENRTVDVNDNSLNKNDIIMILSDIAHGNFLGLTNVIMEDNKYVLNQRVGALKPKKKLNSFFVSKLLTINQSYFRSHGHGSSQQNLSKGDIVNFEIKLPAIDEQNTVAEVLNIADREVLLLEKKLNNTKQQKKYLLNNLITGAIRTPETTV